MFNKFSDPFWLMNEQQQHAHPSAPMAPPIKGGGATDNTPPANNGGGNNTPQSTAAPYKSSASSSVKESTYEAMYCTPSYMKSVYNAVISEHMDLRDLDTIEELKVLDEAEQNSLLLSLTNKLYHMIVGKIDNVDFGDIPQSKGNIYNFSKHKQLRECVDTIHDIFVQYKEDTSAVDEIDHAISNLENNRDLFIASYAGGIEVGKMIYETTTLGIVQSISFMIAVTIEYVKLPANTGLKTIINKTGRAKVKDHIVYQSLVKFNEACSNGEIEKVLRPMIKTRTKNFATIVAGISMAIVIGIFASSIVNFLRDLVYFFYASRERMSTYLDIQANLLEMNAKELKDNKYIATEGDKDKVVRRQLSIAGMFHKVADKIAIDGKSAEITANKDIKADTKQYKIDEVNTDPSNDNVLF